MTIYYNICVNPISVSVAKIIEKLTTEKDATLVTERFIIGRKKVKHRKRYMTSEYMLSALYQKGNKQSAIKAFFKIAQRHR